MKVLLSAYACEPNRGSEQGVGWNWINNTAIDNEVWVLTRKRNEKRINDYYRQYPEKINNNIHFVYVCVPSFVERIKHGNRGMTLYYSIWQKQALKAGKRLVKEIDFDYVQHVTFVSCIQPTFMHKLSIPFIYGPVAGGEKIPKQFLLTSNFSLKERVVEKIRSLTQRLCFVSIRAKNTLKKSLHIYCATEETLDLIPDKYKNKASVMPAIGIERFSPIKKKFRSDGFFNIVMAGRLIYWKAFDIGIEAFKLIHEKMPNVHLHILGSGQKKKDLIALSGELMNVSIFFDDPVPHDNIFDYYSNFDLFLNTSLRDSGCMTLLEAASCGMDCIALSCGGPKVIGSFYNNVSLVNVSNRDETIKRLSEEIEQKVLTSKRWDTECLSTFFSYSKKIKEVENIVKEKKYAK